MHKIELIADANDLGNGTCYSVAFNAAEELRATPSTTYEVLVIRKGKIGEQVSWLPLVNPLPTYANALESGFAENNTPAVPCRATDNTYNLLRSGMAFTTKVDEGCYISAYDGTTARIESETVSFEILVYDNSFIVE